METNLLYSEKFINERLKKLHNTIENKWKHRPWKSDTFNIIIDSFIPKKCRDKKCPFGYKPKLGVAKRNFDLRKCCKEACDQYNLHECLTHRRMVGNRSLYID